MTRPRRGVRTRIRRRTSRPECSGRHRRHMFEREQPRTHHRTCALPRSAFRTLDSPSTGRILGSHLDAGNPRVSSELSPSPGLKLAAPVANGCTSTSGRTDSSSGVLLHVRTRLRQGAATTRPGIASARAHLPFLRHREPRRAEVLWGVRGRTLGTERSPSPVGDGALLRSRRFDGTRGAARRRDAPEGARPLLRRHARRHPGARGDGREVHRGCSAGHVRRP